MKFYINKDNKIDVIKISLGNMKNIAVHYRIRPYKNMAIHAIDASQDLLMMQTIWIAYRLCFLFDCLFFILGKQTNNDQ